MNQDSVFCDLFVRRVRQSLQGCTVVAYRSDAGIRAEALRPDGVVVTDVFPIEAYDSMIVASVRCGDFFCRQIAEA